MHIDCTTCRAPANACADCIVPVLLGTTPPVRHAHPDQALRPGTALVQRDLLDSARLDDDERRALDVLARAGLVSSIDLPIELTVHVPIGVPGAARRAG